MPFTWLSIFIINSFLELLLLHNLQLYSVSLKNARSVQFSFWIFPVALKLLHVKSASFSHIVINCAKYFCTLY